MILHSEIYSTDQQFSLLPGHGPLLNYNRSEKDGGATIAGAIAIVGSIAKLMNDIANDAEGIESKIKEMANQVRNIRDAVVRIEKFLDRLPLLIEATVRDKFAEFVDLRLHAAVTMYLEVKAGLVGLNQIPPVLEERLRYIHNLLSTESRVIMGYGIPAATVLTITMEIEDDCAFLLNYNKAFRRQSLTTIASYFEGVLTGRTEPASEKSLTGYLSSITEEEATLDEYLQWLDVKFSGQQRSWETGWSCTISGYKGNRIKTCKRIHYQASVIGSSSAGFSYQETSRSEITRESVESPFVPADGPEAEVDSDEFSVKNTTLFRKDLIPQRSDIEYANSMLDAKKQLVSMRAEVEPLRDVYASALKRQLSKINAIS